MSDSKQELSLTLTLMQAQIEFQSEVIAKHDKMFEDLSEKIGSLTSKMQVLEEALNKQKESEEQDAAKSALWAKTSSSTGSGDKKISVAEMAKEIAEATLGTETESGYVYDEALGLFYDQNSGYYYDPVKQLFYNGHTQTYYSFDSTTNSYQEVHPKTSNGSIKRKKSKKQVRDTKKHQADKSPTPPDAEDTKSVCDSPKTRRKSRDLEESEHQVDSEHTTKPLNEKSPSDMEEGELSSSLPTTAESSPYTSTNDSCDNTSETENQNQYPPCVRAVVQAGPADLKKGTLFLVPCTGGTIGSCGSSHAILLPCSTVEKKHAKIEYLTTNDETESPANDAPCTSTKSGKYFVTDLGSTEGTFLNRSRLSESRVQSDPHELVHGSTLQIGEVSLLIHIHPGDFTCGHCEPGLILQKEPMYEYTGEKSDKIRKLEMKKVKKKYGLDPKHLNANPTSPPSSTKYTDRAKVRRVKVGSDNPFAKTEVASTAQPIKESNKGFKMLQKMGWKGEGLGSSEGKGIKEPISCDLKADRSGLGFQGPSLPQSLPSSSSKESSKKAKNLAITIERFNEVNVKSENSESPKDISNFDY